MGSALRGAGSSLTGSHQIFWNAAVHVTAGPRQMLFAQLIQKREKWVPLGNYPEDDKGTSSITNIPQNNEK